MFHLVHENNNCTHCLKMKISGKKLSSRFKFYFPGLLGTSPLSKQETEKKIYNWTSEIIPFIHMGNHTDYGHPMKA